MQEEVLFTINWRNDVTTAHVIRYNGVLWKITRVDTFEGYDFSHFIECENCESHLQAQLRHYVDGSSDVGWIDPEHRTRAKDAPRPLALRDSALKAQIAEALGWEAFDADRMFETLSGISVSVDMITLHFHDGGTKAFQYIPPKQIHRKRKEST